MTEAKFCPSCGNGISKGKQFCGACGTEVRNAGPPATPMSRAHSGPSPGPTPQGDRSRPSAPPPPTQPTPSYNQDVSRSQEVAVEGREGCFGGLVGWLVPPAVTGGLGLLLFNAGSRESYNAYSGTTTDLNAMGLVGMSLFLVAIALFTGKGTVAALGRLFRGQGGCWEVLWAPANAFWALVALAAWIGAGIVFAGALGIGPVTAAY